MASANVLENPEEVTNCYEEVRADGNDVNWFVLSYKEKSIALKATGVEYGEMLAHFTAEERCFAYCRMVTGDDMSVRQKFVFITWIGPSVPPLKKAKVSTDKAFVKAIVREFSKEILADDLKDLEESKIKEILELSSGAKY